MSIWDRFMENVDGFDIVPGPWTFRPAHVGLSALGKVAGATGVKQVLEADRWLYENVVTRPITAAQLSFSGDYSPAAAWEAAQDISPGQAFVRYPGGPGSAFLIEKMKDAAGGSLNAQQRDWLRRNALYAAPGFDISAPAQREAAFDKQWTGSLQSGLVDAAVGWWADPLVLAGKGAKVARSAAFTRPATPQQIAKVREQITTQTGGASRAVQWLGAETDVTRIIEHPFVKNSSDPARLAHAFAESQGYDDAARTALAAMGDPQAVRSMWQESASLAEDITAVNAIDDFTAASLSGLNPAHVMQAQSQQYQAVIDDLMRRDQFLADALGTRYTVDPSLGVGPNIVGSASKSTFSFSWRERQKISAARDRSWAGMQKVDPLTATVSNVGELSRRLVSATTHRTYQRNPLVRPARVISWVEGETPSGWIMLKGDKANTSYREMQATLDKVRAWDTEPWVRRQYMQAYIHATTPEQRSAVVQGIETAALRDTVNSRLGHLRNVYGDAHVDAIAEGILTKYNLERSSAVKWFGNKAYLVDDSGELVFSPQLTSQLADGIPFMDIARIDDLLRVHGDAISSLVLHGKTSLTLGYDLIFGEIWRPLVLMRLGYTQRNVWEGLLRTMAHTSSLGNLLDMGEGTKNFLRNRGRNLSNLAAGDAMRFGRPSTKALRRGIDDNHLAIAHWQQRATAAADEITTLQDEIAELQAQLANTANPMDVQALNNRIANRQGRITHRQNVIAQSQQGITALQDEIGVLGQQLAQVKSRMNTKRYRSYEDDLEIRGIRYSGSQAGDAGALGRIDSSADATWDKVVDGPHNTLMAGLRSADTWTQIAPGNPAYFDSLSVAGRQFRSDSWARRLLAGEDPAVVAQRMRGQEGAHFRREMGMSRDDVVDWVAQRADDVERYFPDEQLRRDLAKRDVLPDEMRDRLAGRDDLAPVHGQEIQRALGQDLTLRKAWKATTSKVFRFLGSMPEDIAVRHPFYNAMYTAKVNELGAKLLEDSPQWINNTVLKNMIERQARSFATAETKRVLYTIERYGNVSALMKFVSPFFAAWSNTIRTWLRIVGEDPSVAARANLAWNAPNRVGMVVDNEGNEVPPGAGLTDDQYVVMQLPEALPGVGGMGMRIPKSGINVVLQGEPAWLPGFGPLVQFSASELVKWKPSFEDSVKWAIPYGASSNWYDSFLPPWMKRVNTLSGGEDNQDYMNSFLLIYQAEKLKWREGKRDTKPTLDEVRDRTNAFWKMRTIANLTLPFAPSFQSPYQFYIDEWRRMRDQYGTMEALQRFEKQYPDYFEVTGSLSKNPSKTMATQSAYQRLSKYDTLVADLSGVDPELISLVGNRDLAPGEDPDPFSDAVYEWQKQRKVAPGSSETLRSSQTPQEADNAAMTSKGWVQYFNMKDSLDAILAQRGLTSYQQKGAEDLAAIKSAWVEKQANENPAWWYSYNKRDNAQYARNIQGLQMILSDGKFMRDHGSEPKWLLVARYLAAREQVRAVLATRESQSLTAKSNRDIATAWETYTAGLVAKDRNFADLYNRFLEGDTLGVVPNG